MPPSPRIIGVVNEELYDEVCRLLDIRKPTVKIINGTRPQGRAAWGDYNAAENRIRLFMGVQTYEYDTLRAATREAVITLLHETRHAWQHQHALHIFTNTELAERDAEEYAQLRRADYVNLVRVTRKQHGTGMSRLNKHAIRQSV